MHLGMVRHIGIDTWTGGTMVFPGAAPGAGAADVAGWAFNPPPGWPAPPAGWQPPPDWQPDPAWPAAPAGWNFWVPAQGAVPPGALPRDAPPADATPQGGLPQGGLPQGGLPEGAGGTEIRLSLAGQTMTVRPGQEARIGRSPENDVVVSDPTVSRQHAVVRAGPEGWELANVGSAPTYLGGQQVTRILLDKAQEVTLGSADGPVLRLEPVPAAAPQPAPPVVPAPVPAPVPASVPGTQPAGWNAVSGTPSPSGYGAPQGPPVVPPGWGPPVGQGLPPGYVPGWPGAGQPGAQGGEAELATALRVLFPVQSWLHNSSWRQGLRLAVIAYALLPLIFLTVLSSSSDLSTPGWAYSLYVAPLWAAGFWMLIRPPEHLKKQEILIGVGIVIWTLIWIRVITITINDALPVKNGIGVGSAIVIGINEEVTKALPVLIAGLLLLRYRKVKLDVRMWMFLGTIAGLTFGVAEQAFYTSNDIILINIAKSPSEAVTAILAFAERVFVDGFQHAVWAGISGFFIGMAINYRRRRVQLILLGIGTPALLHALNDWLAGTSPWLVILVQAASLLLFLGYTMSAAAIEQQVRETPIFRGQSMIMEAIKFDQPPPR
jgi:RsiW-degrading membrane proteinase PrsW (M82 family)